MNKASDMEALETPVTSASSLQATASCSGRRRASHW